MIEELKCLRRSLSFVLSKAILDLFPTTLIADLPELTDTQWSNCYLFDHPTHPELLPLLEQKMRQILKSDLTLEQIEMTGRGAAEYFRYHGQPFLEEEANLYGTQLIPLSRYGQFSLLNVGPVYETGFKEVALQLLDADMIKKDHGQFLVKITGTGFFDAHELKQFIKLRKAWLKEKPWQEVERLGWGHYFDQELVLLPKGVDIYHSIDRFWRSQVEHFENLVELLPFSSELYLPFYQKFKKGFAIGGGQDHCHLFASKEDVKRVSISSLHFIHQTFNMMELNVNWVLCKKPPDHLKLQQWKQEVKCLTEALQTCGYPFSIDEGKSYKDHPVVEIRVANTLGERWAGPFLSVDMNFDAYSMAAIEFSLLGEIKHLIALLAEFKQGVLPMSILKGQTRGEKEQLEI